MSARKENLWTISKAAADETRSRCNKGAKCNARIYFAPVPGRTTHMPLNVDLARPHPTDPDKLLVPVHWADCPYKRESRRSPR